jgi:hypothetical protein
MSRKIKRFFQLSTPFPLCVLLGRKPLREVGYAVRPVEEVTIPFSSEIVGLATSTVPLIVLEGS